MRNSFVLGNLAYLVLALIIVNKKEVFYPVAGSSNTPSLNTRKENSFLSRLRRFILTSKKNTKGSHQQVNQEAEGMGQAVRMMKYDRAANVANSIAALDFLGSPLSWYRLDDGVMGGKSETVHEGQNGLHFKGTINTYGGGFASVRADLSTGLAKDTKAIKIRYRGDGKTYKLIMSNGNSAGSPFSRNPSWQIDFPTKKRSENEECEEAILKLHLSKPSFGPSTPSDVSQYKFDPTEMRQIGLMLSLKLSDGSSNPKDTFGEGIFPFSLLVESIEPVVESSSNT